MKNNSAAAIVPEKGTSYKVYGTVRNINKQPVPKVTVKAYNKSIRGRHLLGETVTDASGQYAINYTSKETTAMAIAVCAYDDHKTLLKESSIQYKVPAALQVNISLGEKISTGVSEYEELVKAVTPFTGEISLTELTETDKDHDISFISKKTGLAYGRVESLAMAARFETFSGIRNQVWYGILRENLPVEKKNLLAIASSPADFETKLNTVYDSLMHTAVDILMKGLEKAIQENIIPGNVAAELLATRKKLREKILAYAKKHPATGESSSLYQKLELAGLKGKELQAFLEAYNKHTGSEDEFWKKVKKLPGLKNSRNLDKAEAVFKLSRLTGDNLSLTEKLIHSQKIKSPADIKKLAGYNRSDWEKLIGGPKATASRKNQPVKKQDDASRLETTFTKEFPTAAFAARLQKDKKSKLPHRDKVSKFLQKNDHFNLLHDPVGKFIKENKGAVTGKDATDVTNQLRRIQRVLKLTPSYDTAQVLLNDNIHSAHQVYKMGEDNFVKTYGDRIGKGEATQIFQKASTVHASSLALVGNLKSMADASAINAFPNYNRLLAEQLAPELPNLETLFGHTDFRDTSESNSVYGAPAYLADILHYLDNRESSLTVGNKKVSVKELLLRRRPDIADIDLEGNNSNTIIPYIDIACEIMEDYIAAPVINIANSFLAKFVKGAADSALLTEINKQLTASGLSNINGVLTSTATVSAPYTVNHLQADNTYVAQTHWVIRDSLVTLRANSIPGASTIELRLLHQTLLSSEAISSSPEYINVKAYNNLKAAKRPFTLPFDLFETEGELYLEKLGVKKADLITIFRKEYNLTPGTSPADQVIAYASLGINEAEQTLIFKPDPTHQSLYWGPLPADGSIQVNVFEKLTGLNYSEVITLLQLRILNLGNTVISHDDLSTDTTKQHITNLTPAKLDLIHRFLRLWRKTGLTLNELDNIISSDFSLSKIDSKLAWTLQNFLWLQRSFQLNASQLLALYQNMDKNLYNELFQNSAITSPLNPDFVFNAIVSGTKPMTDVHKSLIAAVLQIPVADVTTLALKTNGTLSLNHLSLIYRHAQFSRCLGISVPELLNLFVFIDTDPFLNPYSTYHFLERYRLLQSSGFSEDEMIYVLLHQDNSSQSLIPSDSQVSGVLSSLQNELLAVRTATQPAPDGNGVLLSKWLSDPVFKWDTNLINKLVDILNTTDDNDYKQKVDDNNNFLLNLHLQYHDVSITADLPALPLAAKPVAPISFPASIASQLSYDADKKQLRLTGYMSQADLTVLKALSKDAPYQAAINSLYVAAQQTDNSAANIFFNGAADIKNKLKGLLSAKTPDRFALFINKLAPVYQKLRQQDVLVKDISTWFKVDKKIVSQLLVSLPGIFNDFTNDNFINKVTTSNNPARPYPVQSDRYQFVAKTCFIAGKLKLTDSDLAFFLAHAADINSLSFQDLPVSPINPIMGVNTYFGFETLVKLLRFQQYYPAKLIDNTSLSIYTIVQNVFNKTSLTPAEITTLKSSFVQLTGWNAADLDALMTTPNFLGLTLPGDIKSVPLLLRLHQCFGVLQELGISAADAANWCKVSLTSADSTKIKQTLKLKYGNSDWLEATRPLQDKLREMKRDALIAYLLANPGTQTWKDDNDLYSYFLLDVEMCSCQPATRIVQATNSVQLFVQRCFLKLEPFITVDANVDSGWKQWQWMKNFRVWQANVKVFLYPENWIEPELLPKEIKSPFLDELENDLLQNEVTAESAEEAFQNYLLKLDSVARLEIKGMWYDDLSKTLHVIGRTYGGNPKAYYYRRLINGRRWTPWQKIELDITSEHIIPVVYNNRVYLFWSVITEQTDQSQQLTVPHAGDGLFLTQPHKNWLIQIAFSEYKDGKWTPKKVSENNFTGQLFISQSDYPSSSSFVFTPMDIPLFEYDKLFNDQGTQADSVEVFTQKMLGAIVENGTILINCYYFQLMDNTAGTFNNCTPLGAFQLDPIKGFPVVASGPYRISLPQTSTTSSMSNMIDVEGHNFHHHGHVNFFTPDQSRGLFRNLIPLQLHNGDRALFLKTLYQTGNTLNDANNQLRLGFFLPHFYQDNFRTYFVEPEFSDNGSFEFSFTQYTDYLLIFLDKGQDAAQAYLHSLANNTTDPQPPLTRYFNFHHPLVDYFLKHLFINGLDSMMDRNTQLKNDIAYSQTPVKFNFKNYLLPDDTIYSGSNTPVTYPNGVVDTTPGYPKDDVDFSLRSGYGLYNWELFFHAPLMIAERLSQNQQFEEADRWYKYIFNPMDMSANNTPSKYWNTKPFFLNTDADYINQRIENILLGINNNQHDLVQDVADWRNNPFQPHYIAEYRTVAYQKVAVMKYVGHLIRHGDYSFRQHTMESINEATQLYILASEILGPKPQIIPSAITTAVDNYYQLEQRMDAFSDALVDVENLMPLHVIKGYNGIIPTSPDLPALRTLYFGIPMNENLVGPTGYWDMVADRLFKIRHCMDIDGNLTPLSVFAPVIDPGMLIRASSAGLDIGTILNDMNASLPVYRFMGMMQRATELCNEVKSLGTAMLSALEKKDVETLSLLRSGHEIKTLSTVLLVKKKQVDEAGASLDTLHKQRELITIRQKYYNGLLQDGINLGEKAALALNIYSGVLQTGSALAYILGGAMHAVPNFTAGVSGLGSPVATITHGGGHLGDALESGARSMGSVAGVIDKAASIINTITSYGRRTDEWHYQLDLANKDLEQIEKQLVGAQIRLDIASQDMNNQQLQIDQAKEASDFMHSKFTNEELFNWMSTQLSNTYFKSYQLAYDIAKQTERCFRYELGLSDSAYINFGYWDSLKKGLLAGEQLFYDVKKMEMAYYEQNKRELELSKPISLSQLDPVALLKLKTTGECWINLPEELFDMDYPGHYMRRIKSVSITIPCISGPYTTVSCKLTMTKNSVRTSGIGGSDTAQYSRKLSNGVPTDDPRFRDAVGALQFIATSNAQNDSGLFELNFRDDRYLPFEGAGAISLWHLELPAAIRQFDYDTISDVIIHLKYTARDGGDMLKGNATASLAAQLNQMLVSTKDKGLMRIFSAKNDLPTEWYRFLHPVNATDDQSLTLNLDNTRFPLFVQGKIIKITSIELVADSTVAPVNNIQVVSPAPAANPLSLTATGIYGKLLSGSIDYSSNKKDPGTWIIKNPVANPRLTDSALSNLVIIVHYEVS